MKLNSLIMSALFLLVLSINVNAQPEFTEHQIQDGFDEATCVYVIDMDADGDMDIVGSAFEDSEVGWWENVGEDGFDYHSVDRDFGGAQSIMAADFNGDQNIDFVSCSVNDEDVSWWENNGEQEFTEHLIDGNFGRAYDVFASDLDSDGDIDILGVNYTNNGLYWWENSGEGNFSAHQIDGNFARSSCVFAADLDGDGDMDVLGASGWGNEVAAWWENDGEEDFERHNLDARASNIAAADIDGDGDMDIYGGAQYSDEFYWWENDGADDPSFDDHLISDEVDDPAAVDAADLDLDGDLDLITGIWAGGIFAWWENNGEEDPGFEYHVLSDNRNGACSVSAADIDGDGDIDIAGAARGNSDAVYWWENDLDPVQDEPPESCNLFAPANDSILTSLPVEFVWSKAPDISEETAVNYRIELSRTDDFAELSAFDTGEDTTLIIEQLDDNADYWWRVFSVNPVNDEEVVSEETWHFSTAIPESPTDFDLLRPEHLSILPPEKFNRLQFIWQESFDPDPDEDVSYILNLVVLYNNNVSRFSYDDLADTSLIVAIPDSLGIEYWQSEITTAWYVQAISGEDTTRSVSVFHITAESHSAIKSNSGPVPERFRIAAVYPNPFNSVARVRYSVSEPGFVKLNLLDIQGRKIRELVNDYITSGYHEVIVNHRDLKSGVYILELANSREHLYRKLTLVE